MISIVERARISRSVDPIDWTFVRPVYKKLHDDFHLITRPFGIRISEATNLHLAILISTIDSIDRTIDDLKLNKHRAQFANALVSYLSGRTVEIESEFVSDEVADRMRSLRHVIIVRGIRSEFCETVERIFYLTEAKRVAITQQEMIGQMQEEWRLAGHLTVLILGAASTPAFEKFFYLCCQMMTAVDMIDDAADDFRTGQISIKPSATLYIRLLCEILFPLPKLIWLFPKSATLFRYAAGFIREVCWPSSGSTNRNFTWFF